MAFGCSIEVTTNTSLIEMTTSTGFTVYLKKLIQNISFLLRWFMATLTTSVILFIIDVSLAFVVFVAYYADQKYRQILQPYRGIV